MSCRMCTFLVRFEEIFKKYVGKNYFSVYLLINGFFIGNN